MSGEKKVKGIKKGAVEKSLDCALKNPSYKIEISISEDRIVTLEGLVDTWQEVVNAGHAVAKVKGVRNVVNNMRSKDYTPTIEDNSEQIAEVLRSGNTERCDVVIVGGGVSGCAIARVLGKYELDVMLLEKNSDIASESTKANNGNIHPGVRATPGSLKAELNLKGNAMYTKLAEDLDFTLKRPGSLGVFYNKNQWRMFKLLKVLRDTGIGKHIKPLSQIMKVPGLKWLSAEEVNKLEPNLRGEPVGGFLMTTMGLVEPFEVCQAFAENAADNGVTFKLNTKVLDIIKENNIVTKVVTDHSVIECKTVINAAGVYADNIAEMVDDKFYTIHPRKGSIAIFDKNRKGFFNTPAGAMGQADHTNNTKGGGASITPEGNMLWGPTAKEIPNKEDKSVEPGDIEYIMHLGAGVTDEIKRNEIITYFAGVRAPDYKEDFIVEPSRHVEGFIHVAGIQSPGLASAPAIAEMVEGFVKEQYVGLNEKKDYNPKRVGIPKFRELSHAEQDELIKKNPKYGNIICRCEMITEGEIVDAIHSSVPATTLDAVKRRTRAGMGRCQSGFCGPKVVELLSRELGVPMEEVTLKGADSKILLNNNRELGGHHD